MTFVPGLKATPCNYCSVTLPILRVGCVAGELVLRDDGHEAGAKAVGGLYWRYEQWIRNCEAKVDSPLGYTAGFMQFVANWPGRCRKELFSTICCSLLVSFARAIGQLWTCVRVSMISGPRVCAENFIARSARWRATSNCYNWPLVAVAAESATVRVDLAQAIASACAPSCW